MSEETWLLEKDLCRCCHAKGKFKNLSEPCLDSGEVEIYADMLKYCFDIEISPVPGLICAVTYTICEMCIGLLRDATKFKKSVIVCEEKFKKISSEEEKFKNLFSKNIIEVENQNLNELLVKVKIEKRDSFHGESDNDFDSAPDFDFGEQENKQIPEDNMKKKPRKYQMKSKKFKSQSKKKTGIVKAGPKPDDRPVQIKKPYFRFKDEDYTEDGVAFICKRCDKIYFKKCSIQHHVKTIHYNIKPLHICPHCKKEFKTPTLLTTHKLEELNVDDRFKCNACKRVYVSQRNLRKHIHCYHMLGQRHSCEFCDYESFSVTSMNKHKVKHKTSKDYHCKFCKKSFLRL